MKKYLLFLFDSHSVGGGWSDFHKDYNDIDKARSRAREETLWNDY